MSSNDLNGENAEREVPKSVSRRKSVESSRRSSSPKLGAIAAGKVDVTITEIGDIGVTGAGDDDAELLAQRFEAGSKAEIVALICARNSQELLGLVMGHLSSYGRLDLFRPLPIEWRISAFVFLRPSEQSIIVEESDAADNDDYIENLPAEIRLDTLMGMSQGAVVKVSHLLSQSEKEACDLKRGYPVDSVGRIMHHVPTGMALLSTITVGQALEAVGSLNRVAVDPKRSGGVLFVRTSQNKLVGWTDSTALLRLANGMSAHDASYYGKDAVAQVAATKKTIGDSNTDTLSSASSSSSSSSSSIPLSNAAESPRSTKAATPINIEASNRILADVAFPFLHVLQTTDNTDELLRQYSVSDNATLPVVDAEGILLGVVRARDSIKLLNARIATISAGDSGIHSYSKASPMLLVQKRLFWLFVLAALNFGVAAVVASFEEVISSNLVLAGFIPLLAGMGGNIGAQSSGLVIAGVSSRDISPRDVPRILVKETIVGIALSVILGVVTGIMGYIRGVNNKPGVAQTLGFSMVVIAIISNYLGAIFPFAAIAVGVDPAVSSSPLITTVIDVLGISIYLFIAKAILGDLAPTELDSNSTGFGNCTKI